MNGDEITDAINADPAEVKRLRAARRQVREELASRRRCDSAISYASEMHDCTPGQPLPVVPPLQCEKRAGHTGSHGSGVHNWTRAEWLEPA